MINNDQPTENLQREALWQKLKVLNESIWEHRAPWPTISLWLNNFTGATASVEDEHLHALHLLSQFMYFGSRESRALLRALYRDVYKYPIVESIRESNGDTTEESLIRRLFEEELKRTRFLGLGNPSESGTHLLYYFRQENCLPKELFINTHEIFDGYSPDVNFLSDPEISRYVFLDDLCASGEQAQRYSKDVVAELKRLKPDALVAYYVLFATTEALDAIRTKTQFDAVNCVFDLDPSFHALSEGSRYFPTDSKDLSRDLAKAMCLHYGQILWPAYPLGYRDGQFLLGFHHNTPDNTLPVIWFDEPGTTWQPVFRRYPKIEQLIW